MTKVTLLLIVMLMTSLTAETKDVILTFRRDGNDYKEAFRGLKSELNNECVVKEHVITKNCRVEEMTELMGKIRPRLVILMDNTAIALYRRYQKSLDKDAPVVPSIALMGVMIKEAIKGLKKASGISYEVPIVTSLVSLRSVLSIDMKKVGVVHREYLNDFLDKNRVFCRNEGIEVVDITLPNKNGTSKSVLNKALKDLDKKGVEVLWIPNDNALLHPDIIKGVWIPTVRRMKIPVVVGVEVLVEPRLNFGTFAVLPDHVSLGSQAAEMVFEIMDNNWEMDKPHVDPPLAVYKIINLPQAKRYFEVNQKRLMSIDKKLKW